MLTKKIKHLMDKNGKPSFKKISIHLDGKVFELYNKVKRIYIPLKKNSYAESLEGLRKKEYVPATDVIAIDLGLNPLFATDRGDLIR
jgi:hypothetical protein